MCLIVAQKAQAPRMTKSDMRLAWEGNNDGSGYCFVENGELVVRKPYFKLKKLIRDYNMDFDRVGGTTPFIVHFRFATSGKMNSLNTHPHILAGGKVALTHNGIFSYDAPTAALSDTVWFCQTVLAARNESDLYSKAVQDVMETYCGVGNKLALLRNDGEMLFINEDMGEWDADETTWYSQSHWAYEYTKVPQYGGSGAWKYATRLPKECAEFEFGNNKYDGDGDTDAKDDHELTEDERFDVEMREAYESEFGFGSWKASEWVNESGVVETAKYYTENPAALVEIDKRIDAIANGTDNPDDEGED